MFTFKRELRTMGTPTIVPLNTAREMLDYLSPLNPIWDSGSAIFRGQGSEHYKLTPSICRSGAGSFANGSPQKAFVVNFARQIEFELEVLSRFLAGCDRSGLVVPGYTKDIKEKLANNRSLFLSHTLPWPQAEMHEIMAVAQHYDVPTRLLDWTTRSYVACYFAASSANFEVNSQQMPRLAVWALDTTFSRDWKNTAIIRPPGGTSQNQAAQSGLFTTHYINATSFIEDYQSEALEEVDEIYGTGNSSSSLIKITLPIDEAPNLLTLCSKLGVDASTLFPGFHGVAKNVRDWANVTVGVRPSRALLDEMHMESDDPYFQ